MSKFRTLVLTAIAGLALMSTVSLQAQTNAIKVFAPVNVNTSIQNGPSSYGTNTISITCSGSVTAKLSSTADGSSNLLEDNLLYLNNLTNTGLTPPDGGDNHINGGLNVCRGGDTNSLGNSMATNCFQQAYEDAAHGKIGVNPDTLVSTYGVAPIDVSSYLSPGDGHSSQKLQFDLIDYGGLLGTSTIYLVTNCTQDGVVSGGTLTGNPITPSDQNSLNQNLPFDSTDGQRVQFIADLTSANQSGTLTIPPGTIPFVKDNFITQADYHSMVAGTSLATSDCIPLVGELDSNGQPACKFFTITCINSSNNVASGNNCPQSTARNSIFRSKYDSVQNVPGAVEGLVHGTGYGFLMGSDNWIAPSQNCVFPSGLEFGYLCPQNIETEFLGDFSSGGGTKGLNSTFIAVVNVPLPVTTVTVTPSTTYGWTNSLTPAVTFVSNPAVASGNGFIAAPIASVTYGVADAVRDTALPVPGDSTLTNSSCLTAPMGNATAFTPPPVTLGRLEDGSHSLHYFATDCAATEELVYKVQTGFDGNWASFKVQPIKVDTQSPTAAFSSPQPPANNTLVLHQSPVTVPFTCSDSGSGLAVCGTSSGQTLGITGLPIYSGAATVSANSLGTTNLAVFAQDLAGNTTNTSTISYTVQYSNGSCFGEAGHQILWPINANGTSVFKKGTIVIARFRVCDAKGASIGTPGTIKSATVQTIGGSAPPHDGDNDDDDGKAPFFWDPLGRQWVHLAATGRLLANRTYVYTVTLNDNSTIVFQFGLR